MASKRVTIKELAAEAGVSIATVSYVLNNRTDQKISEEKRKKILQLANLYHYIKNPAAASLASGHHGLVSLIFDMDTAALPLANKSIIADRLTRAFLAKGYRVCLEPAGSLPDGSMVDAIVAVGLSAERFREVGNNVFIPLISVDSLVGGDWLFNVIYDDYDLYDGQTLVCLPVASSELMNYFREHFDVRVVTSLAEYQREPLGCYVRDPALLPYLREGDVGKDCFGETKIAKVVETTLSSINEEGASVHCKI